MTTGSQKDTVRRIKSLLPNGWFQGDTPILDAVLAGIAWALAQVYSFAAYARLQTRITTATDGFLDLISYDFFGIGLPRKLNEPDSSFRTRIKSLLLLERATRAGLIKTLTALTGRIPWVFEPANTGDTGGLNTNSMGLNAAGGLGNLSLPFQCFVIAYRPVGQGIPNIAGLGYPQGALNTPSQSALSNLSQIVGAITDADIYRTIDSVMPVGTIAWTQISS
jgi:hypothetical protein